MTTTRPTTLLKTWTKLPSLFFLAALLLCGCNSITSTQRDYLVCYQQLDYDNACSGIDRCISKKVKNGDYRSSGDSPVLLLDKATTQFAMGDVKHAINDYQKAIEAIDFFSQQLLTEEAGKVVLQDKTGAYPGDDYEQILARVYFALALYQDGDDRNAMALLKQAEEVQQKKAEHYRNTKKGDTVHLVENPLAKVLLGTAVEKVGDSSNAEILYRQAGYTLPETPPDSPTVLVCCHRGVSPYKVTVRTDASILSTLAIEAFLDEQGLDHRMMGVSGLPIPALRDFPGTDPYPIDVDIDGDFQQLVPIYDISAVADEQLQEQLPMIIARGLLRHSLRRGAVEVADNHSSGLADVMDVAFTFWNLSNQAETRSWGTLPRSIDLARYDLSPGQHTVSFLIGDNKIEKRTLNLKPNDLCVINVFYPKDGTAQILIPNPYLHTQGEKL